MKRHYNVTLRDVAEGTVTHRELICYIQYMPRDSAMAHDTYGPAADWGQQEHLLGDIVDLLDAANHQRSGSKKRWKSQLKRPEVPRGHDDA